MSRYTVQGEYLCEYVDHCTCGAGTGGYYGAHEPGCGLEPVGPIEQLLEAQPVAPASDTAVLAGLVEEMRTRAEQYDVQGTANTDLVAFGIARAIALVEAAQQRQATSGARAAGGEPSDDVIENAARAARAAYGTWLGGWDDDAACPEYKRNDWRNVARAVLAAAPPTPSAHGVAALLAECARRQETYGDEWISIKQVQRLLAPEGAEGEGT